MSEPAVDIDDLISAIRERPVLWNRKHTNYHNRTIINREWRKVAKELGADSDLIKKKWKNLRDTFAKSLKQRCKLSASENEPQYKGTWVHFSSMLFLESAIKSKNAENQESEYVHDFPKAEKCLKSDSDNNSDEEAFKSPTENYPEIFIVEAAQKNDSNFQHAPNPSNSQVRSTAARIILKRKNDEGLEGNHDPERKKQHINYDTEDLHWLKSILPHMKKLPPLNKLIFRTQMQELLIAELSKISSGSDAEEPEVTGS